MAKLATCPYCNEKIQVNQPQKTYKGKHYHTSCYKKMCQEVYSTTQENTDSKQILYDYICSLFKINELSPFLSAQLKKFENEYNMTYDGMWYSLKYYFEILDNPVDKTKGIGIIPYVYEEAKIYYKKVLNLTTINNKPVNATTINVQVNPNKPRPKKQIDISNL